MSIEYNNSIAEKIGKISRDNVQDLIKVCAQKKKTNPLYIYFDIEDGELLLNDPKKVKLDGSRFFCLFTLQSIDENHLLNVADADHPWIVETIRNQIINALYRDIDQSDED